MESKTVIAILSVIVILLAIGIAVEFFAFNNNSQPSNILNNTTSQNTTVESISSDSKASNGNLTEWKAVEGVSGYRRYRKTVGASWSVLADITSGNSYVDTSA